MVPECALRPRFFHSSSDVIGSFYRRDSKSNVKYIVTKISERCGTAQKLMYFTRKYRKSDNRVTRPEFRFMLKKFGIVLPVSASVFWNNLIFTRILTPFFRI